MKRITIVLAVLLISSTVYFFANQAVVIKDPAPDHKPVIQEELVGSGPSNQQPTDAKATLVSMEARANNKNTNSNFSIQPIPNYLNKSIKWLADAQAPNGGWGPGQQVYNNTRNGAASTDPATTAFCAIALARTGSNLDQGLYQDNLKRALNYLLECVEKTPAGQTNITNQTGTQPQRKLGQNIDVSMAIQFFGRVLYDDPKDEVLKARVNEAMDHCIAMLNNTQQKDGSWNNAGWAPVLNSVMANNALEMSANVGKDVDDMLEQSRYYQKTNLDSVSGTVKTDKAAGISLYALSSTKRATAKESREANTYFDEVKKSGDLKNAIQSESEAYYVLKKKYDEVKARKLAKSYQSNKMASQQLNNDAVLSGFGNNGGEEYLSYMMTSESHVTDGDQNTWDNWHEKMSNLFEKVQNGNGSWTGQHCITSPVFCTAAVVMTLTADRDADLLLANK